MTRLSDIPHFDSPLGHRLRALRDRVDWMMLFPVAAAFAWFLGEAAVAVVLAVILPAFLALQGRPAGATARGAPRAGAAIAPDALRRQVDDILTDCAALNRTTAVLRLHLSPKGNEDWDEETRAKVTARLALRVMAAMRGQDQVLRTGATDLVLLLCPTRRADLQVLMNIVDRVQMAVAEPISLDGATLSAQSAIGVCSETMATSRTGHALLRGAETALTVARREREDSVRFFNADLRAEAEIDAQLTREIDAALEGGQIGAWFQPQIDAATGEIAGFEALARWTHPELGVLEPDRFLSAAQASGRMSDLGEAVLAAALDALASWDAAGLTVPGICVNLSMEELADPRLAERMVWQVDQRDVRPTRIAFELPSSVTELAEDAVVQANIEELRHVGFRLDLDDFGTGPATVSHVSRFGVHRIVLDRSLVAGIDVDPARRRVVAAILAMAEVLGLVTLAEGVETDDLQALLKRMGCVHLQGFAVARAMPLVDTLTWLRGRVAARGAAMARQSRVRARTEDAPEPTAPRAAQKRWLQ
ncbi:GGDEF domain-containing phosphodiesterase [Jannaschia seohaensis]|uniref:EAL domain, c-di-GMP-specific phosphodiesterase class I (Or its enzymatically inactive variant) n=1 Tax=Jannaschia seohaensis TaxID=475081 RepID=A0A2Y9AAQ3_9RHOB|nr:GGDEF domain-containing phosphodiesterase [Jannaschia seohaensis]PWJ20940.1 EAL domain-containing protein (putative c-di-GMP-specific phosphodiesterase class I) [Jannaschia seohaensis]SSA41350.1 EAL domain, c-di-GMP-specific phosphodiesterase class I (or its enzymatically inactive variant) [Jannaschia seohaensis]